MNPALCHTGSRLRKIFQLFQRSLVMAWGHSASAFYSVKLCVMINVSLRHNVLCFSFVVVLYSMYSLCAIIKVVILNERGLSLLTWSTDH